MSNEKTGELSFRELEKQTTGGIYVLNNTQKHERGMVIFTVPKTNAMGFDTVHVAPTFIPLDLMEQVSRRQLLDSSEFRRCIATRRLLLITQEYAESLLEEEGASEEKERLFNLQEAHNTMVQSLDDIETGDMLDPDLANIGERRRGPDGEIETAGKNSNGLEFESDVHPKVEGIMEDLALNGDEQGAMNSLKNMGALGKADYTYIVKKADKKHIRLKEWASGQLKPKAKK